MIYMHIYVYLTYIYIYMYKYVLLDIRGLGASNETVFPTSFDVLLFSREFFEIMKFTKLIDAKCSSNKMVSFKLGSDAAGVVLENLDNATF